MLAPGGENVRGRAGAGGTRGGGGRPGAGPGTPRAAPAPRRRPAGPPRARGMPSPSTNIAAGAKPAIPPPPGHRRGAARESRSEARRGGRGAVPCPGRGRAAPPFRPRRASRGQPLRLTAAALFPRRGRPIPIQQITGAGFGRGRATTMQGSTRGKMRVLGSADWRAFYGAYSRRAGNNRAICRIEARGLAALRSAP